MSSLSTTLVRIVLLRSGPEALPKSMAVLGYCALLSALSILTGVALLPQLPETAFFPILYSALISVLCYAGVIWIAGRGDRMLQGIAAILGASAVIWFCFVLIERLLTPLLGATESRLVGDLIQLWSVPVEGRIMASVLSWHWYLGIMIAVVVMLLQFVAIDFVIRR